MGLYAAFADVLSYPRADLLAAVDACVAEIRENTQGAAHLLEFRAEAERLGIAPLEEAYTAAFDLDPACSLYVGHHLFGENARRSAFMCRLVEIFALSLTPDGDGEPPDHLPRILRYLEGAAPGPASDDLVGDAVVPALVRVAGALEQAGHPYAPAVHALLDCLRARQAATCGEETRA